MKRIYKSPILNEPEGTNIDVRPSQEIYGEDPIYKFTFSGFEDDPDALAFLQNIVGYYGLLELDTDENWEITYDEYLAFYG